MAKVIEIAAQANSPFEREPQLLGVYHFNDVTRSLHLHEDRVELNFILSGNGTVVVNGELCNTQAGDVLIYNSGVLHDESLILSTQNAWCIAVTNLKLPNLRENELVPKNFSPRIPCQSVAEDLGQLYPMIHRYVQQENGYPVANALARAVVLLVNEVIRTSARAETKETHFVVERILHYIEEHYAEEIEFAALAALVNANENYLSHVFKKVTNYSPLQYVVRRRIGKAQCLLIYTTLTLTEISARVGYDDPNYFSRIFKKVVGVTPRSYRQHWRESSIGSAPSDI